MFTVILKYKTWIGLSNGYENSTDIVNGFLYYKCVWSKIFKMMLP